MVTSSKGTLQSRYAGDRRGARKSSIVLGDESRSSTVLYCDSQHLTTFAGRFAPAGSGADALQPLPLGASLKSVSTVYAAAGQ